MPTNLSEVWRERKTTQLGFTLFEQHFNIPELMRDPHEVDYNTDDDSDGEHKGFGLKVPELSDLINDFEKDDDFIAKTNETTKNYKHEQKVKGIDLETRYDIKSLKKDKVTHLEGNISIQRDEWGSRVMGMVEDVNEIIKDPKNKIYLR